MTKSMHGVGMRTAAAVALAALFPSLSSVAAPPETETRDIPLKPSAPPKLRKALPNDPFLCSRRFVYQGRPIECDSGIQRDGENLRPILRGVPSAVSELDAYQSTRNRMKYTAYVTSAGLAAFLIGYFMAKPFRDPDGHLSFPGAYIELAGALLGMSSMGYGVFTYFSNERHLSSAVNEYNRVKPDDPIELQFSTGIRF